MSAFEYQLLLAGPFFLLVFAGYAAMRFLRLPRAFSQGATRVIFIALLPAMLFRLMSSRANLPPVDARLLLAFFGGCLLVFALGRWAAWKGFGLDGSGQTVFAMGGIFSNNVMLGLPLAHVTLGDAAMPSVALVLLFNALILWTLVTVSIEWSRHGSFSLRGIAQTLRSVLVNPVVASILAGAAFSYAGLHLPAQVDTALTWASHAAAPACLVALGMGLAEMKVREGLRLALGISAFKLLVHPLVVWALAALLGLPAMETRVVVLLASIGAGANVFLMARQFGTLEGPMASALVITTAGSALTTPVFLILTGLLA